MAENTSTTVLTVQATDADLPGVSLVYGIAVGGDGAKFSINSSTGVLSGIPAATGDFSAALITATDAGGCTATAGAASPVRCGR